MYHKKVEIVADVTRSFDLKSQRLHNNEVSLYFYVTGIVSIGSDCGQPKWPGIYVDVTKYEGWIMEKMNGAI